MPNQQEPQNPNELVNGIPRRIRDAYSALIDDMIRLYDAIGNPLIPDAVLGLEIEHVFHKRLTEEVCEITGLNWGACLVAAVKLIKERRKPA